MKIAVISMFALMVSSATAFAPSAAFTRGVSTQVFSEPEDEDGLDLNLEEMFDMWVWKLKMLWYFKKNLIQSHRTSNQHRFDAADKGEEFDDAIKKVKTSDE